MPCRDISSNHTCHRRLRHRSWGHVPDRRVSALQDDWYRRAELALGKGEEDLAREALKRRKAYEVPSQTVVHFQFISRRFFVSRLAPWPAPCSELIPSECPRTMRSK